MPAKGLLYIGDCKMGALATRAYVAQTENFYLMPLAQVGDLPEQCAALNRTSINPQILTVEAALTGSKELVYQAALLDPHTAAELSIDDIVSMCDDLIAAHGRMLPKLR